MRPEPARNAGLASHFCHQHTIYIQMLNLIAIAAIAKGYDSVEYSQNKLTLKQGAIDTYIEQRGTEYLVLQKEGPLKFTEISEVTKHLKLTFQDLLEEIEAQDPSLKEVVLEVNKFILTILDNPVVDLPADDDQVVDPPADEEQAIEPLIPKRRKK
jgi:hypothetical protein